MGVMSCSRRNCENIMCSRYSSAYGYLCAECLQELIDKGPDNITDFMKSEKKPYYKPNTDAWEKFIITEFKEVYEEDY